MRHKEKINWLKVALYSIALFVLTISVVATLTYALLKFGYDVSEDTEIFVLVSNLPSLAIHYLLYFNLAKGQLTRPFEHAFIVYAVTLGFGFILDLLIPVSLISWTVFVVELFIYVAILIVATKQGIKCRAHKGLIDNAA